MRAICRDCEVSAGLLAAAVVATPTLDTVCRRRTANRDRAAARFTGPRSATAAMRVYDFLHCRPSIWQNRLDAGHFASGQLLRHLIGVIHRRTQRLAWFEMGHGWRQLP